MSRDTELQAVFIVAGSRVDRRRKARIMGPVPAKLRGTSDLGARFNLDANLDNLSSGGLYLRLGLLVKSAMPLFVLFRIPFLPDSREQGTRWAALGAVARVEPLANGSYGLAVKFKKYREI